MAAVISIICGIVLFFFASTSLAQPYGSYLCKQPGYTCYKVKGRDSWQSLFHNKEQRDLVMRINRMNTAIYGGMHIAIPVNLQDTDIMDYAPMPRQISAPGEKVVIVSLSPKVLAWGAYDESGTLQGWGPISGGQGWCPDTHRACRTSQGKFSVYGFGGADCKSTKFPLGRGGAPMPYCMFFHGGFAMHGSHDVPGYNASHGCVRLFIPDAKWLQHEFMDRQTGTKIIVTNEA